MANGNGWVAKTLIGGAVSLISGGMFVMGNGIIDNDRNNTEQHIKIRQEIIQGDKEVREKLNVVKDIAIDIRLEQRELSNELKHTLEKIDKKL